MSSDKLDYNGLQTLVYIIKNYVKKLFLHPGVIQTFAGNSLPDGWLLCDGSAISRSTYSELFEVIGTTYGSGDGSTTFNLPNLFNRMVVGAGGIYELADMGGESSHVLTQAELASHTHTFTGSAVTSGNQSAGHTHSRGTMNITGKLETRRTSWNSSDMVYASGAFYHNGTGGSMDSVNQVDTDATSRYISFDASKTWSGSTSGISANHNHSVTAAGTNSNTGSNTAHNNMPPYIAMRYIIKY